MVPIVQLQIMVHKELAWIVIVNWIAFGWFVFKAITTKKYRHIIAAVTVFLLQLLGWPFFWHGDLVWGLLGVAFAVLLGVEQAINKRIDRVSMYIIGFLGLAAVYFANYAVALMQKR